MRRRRCVRMFVRQHTAQVLFPHVDRTCAENSVLHMVMFIANYAFYKFGVEVSGARACVTNVRRSVL
jgi:hypothetical protein